VVSSTKLPPIGSPPQSVATWLYSFARTNDDSARTALWPWDRMKYRGQAWAFRTAAELVERAEQVSQIELLSPQQMTWIDGHWHTTVYCDHVCDVCPTCQT